MDKSGIVLLYHRIGLPLVRSIVRSQYIAPPVLKWQLNSLNRYGYHPISMAEALANPEGTRGRYAITFDDGYASIAESACPLLMELGIPATIYLVVSHIGGTNHWDQLKGDRIEKLMTTEQIREWAAAGIEMGSHTLTHAQLTDISDSQLKAEVGDSKHLLEDMLGQPVHGFSYPYGAWNPRVRDAVIAAGYKYGLATTLGSLGSEIDPYAIPRVHMRWATIGGALHRKIEKAQKANHADS